MSTVAHHKYSTKTKTLKQPWNVLAVSRMQACIWTPPTAETFQVLFYVLWNKTISSTRNGISFTILFQFYFNCTGTINLSASCPEIKKYNSNTVMDKKTRSNIHHHHIAHSPEAVVTGRHQVRSKRQKPEHSDQYRLGVASWCGVYATCMGDASQGWGRVS